MYTVQHTAIISQLYLKKLVKKCLVYFISQDKCQFFFILIFFGRQTFPSLIFFTSGPCKHVFVEPEATEPPSQKRKRT